MCLENDYPFRVPMTESCHFKSYKEGQALFKGYDNEKAALPRQELVLPPSWYWQACFSMEGGRVLGFEGGQSPLGEREREGKREKEKCTPTSI